MVAIENYYHRSQFTPTSFSLIANPFLIIRYLIYRTIKNNGHYLRGKVLDFGCGTSPYRKILVNVDEYWGLDYGNETFDYTNKKVLTRSSIIPFENETFDSILCTEVLEHVPDPGLVLSEFYRVLKRGGFVLITVPLTFREHPHPYDFRRFTEQGIIQELINHGFLIEKSIKMGSYILTLTQLFAEYIRHHLIHTEKYGWSTIAYRIFWQTILLLPLFITGFALNLILPDKGKVLPLGICVVAQKPP